MITERVDASVDFKFTKNDGTCSIKELEEYIFTARMRGAEDNSRAKFTVHDGYPYANTSYTNGMSVSVPATMGGFPVVPAQPKVPSRTKARVIAASIVTLPLVLLSLLLWLAF